MSDVKEKEIRNKIHESLFFFGKIGQNAYIYANRDRNMNNYAPAIRLKTDVEQRIRKGQVSE